MMPCWEYLTVYLSGELNFPEIVDRAVTREWAGKSISQQINAYAAQGWAVLDLHWLAETELMVTLQRPAGSQPGGASAREDADGNRT